MLSGLREDHLLALWGLDLLDVVIREGPRLWVEARKEIEDLQAFLDRRLQIDPVGPEVGGVLLAAAERAGLGDPWFEYRELRAGTGVDPVPRSRTSRLRECVHRALMAVELARRELPGADEPVATGPAAHLHGQTQLPPVDFPSRRFLAGLEARHPTAVAVGDPAWLTVS